MTTQDPENPQSPMMHDEAISAWLDGGLEKDGAAAMQEIAALNESVAQRAARFRHMDDLVRRAVPEEESVPQALLDRLGLGLPARGNADVVDLAQARASRAARQAARSAPRIRFAQLSGGWRVAAQVTLVVGLGLAGMISLGGGDRNGTQAVTGPRAEYAALGDASGIVAQANALVMFSSGVDSAERRELFSKAGARVVSGPSANGAWQLAIDPAKRADVLEDLRRRDDVTLAEPLDGARP